MNLPNKLTILRIVLVPFFIAAILIDFPFHYLAALAVFGAASLTDMFDGKIARRRNLVTNFGKFSDPLADKILVLSALVCFIQAGLCDAILVIVVLFREFTVTSIRLVAASEGKVVAANIWGKVKTVTQITAIIIIFVLQITLDILKMVPMDSALISNLNFIFYIIGEAALWISTVFCIISGVIYLKDNKDFISME
ncbi:MAG: CDP-diacylglycerol--glycerol-3-phosphate 3-phosphatidyltransferase [Ruminococcus sp.]|jgi:CDP-diacylglycerol--glycerol-3-phosphate 3-phosphatidyltransferase|nr:CDP-diacylglycerol--glycerol-3-phosphate 3-phosphatidyltransferase [Ruminococcus sp.]